MKKVPSDFAGVADELVRMRVHEGYAAEEISPLLRQLDAEVLAFQKGETISCGPRRIGVILEGAVHVFWDEGGEKGGVLRMLSAGGFVGLTAFVAPRARDAEVNVAFADSTVVTLSVERLLEWRHDPASDRFFASLDRQVHAMLVETSRKCAILSHTKIEDRVFAFLKQRCTSGNLTVVVPGNEADFASYLGVHTVALSRVLRKMRAAGFIDYRRNVLTLLCLPH